MTKKQKNGSSQQEIKYEVCTYKLKNMVILIIEVNLFVYIYVEQFKADEQMHV